ncbi:MAG: MarR family winged helix-turn-helix transcriptional regulator [Rhodobacteraceae bacterium]|nr:MarR family winged helix-turn-helix transcriptional regulator [Paracoccaceae bacterium]
MSDKSDCKPPTALAELGLNNFPPYLMNRIMGRYNETIQGEMNALGLSTPKMRCLAVLAVKDGMLIGELSVLAVVQQSTLSRALEALVKDKLVLRETDPHDNRAMRIYITDAGRDLFENLWPRISQSVEQMFTGISADERQALVTTLHKMLGNTRKHDF